MSTLPTPQPPAGIIRGRRPIHARPSGWTEGPVLTYIPQTDPPDRICPVITHYELHDPAEEKPAAATSLPAGPEARAISGADTMTTISCPVCHRSHTVTEDQDAIHCPCGSMISHWPGKSGYKSSFLATNKEVPKPSNSWSHSVPYGMANDWGPEAPKPDPARIPVYLGEGRWGYHNSLIGWGIWGGTGLSPQDASAAGVAPRPLDPAVKEAILNRPIGPQNDWASIFRNIKEPTPYNWPTWSDLVLARHNAAVQPLAQPETLKGGPPMTVSTICNSCGAANTFTKDVRSSDVVILCHGCKRVIVGSDKPGKLVYIANRPAPPAEPSIYPDPIDLDNLNKRVSKAIPTTNAPPVCYPICIHCGWKNDCGDVKVDLCRCGNCEKSITGRGVGDLFLAVALVPTNPSPGMATATDQTSPSEKPGTRQFSTGAVRSKDANKCAYHLVTPIGLRRVAEAYKEGEGKYGAYNCEKGFPIDDLLNHVIRHIYAYLSGDRSEDHLGHGAWGMMMSCHSEEMWPHLNQNLRGPGCTPPKPYTTMGTPEAHKTPEKIPFIIHDPNQNFQAPAAKDNPTFNPDSVTAEYACPIQRE